MRNQSLLIKSSSLYKKTFDCPAKFWHICTAFDPNIVMYLIQTFQLSNDYVYALVQT